MQDRHHLVPLWRPTLWNEVRILDLRRQPGTLLSPLTHQHTLSTHREHQVITDPLNSSEWAITCFYSDEAEGGKGRGTARCGRAKRDVTIVRCDENRIFMIPGSSAGEFSLAAHSRMMTLIRSAILRNFRLLVDSFNSGELHELITLMAFFLPSNNLDITKSIFLLFNISFSVSRIDLMYRFYMLESISLISPVSFNTILMQIHWSLRCSFPTNACTYSWWCVR